MAAGGDLINLGDDAPTEAVSQLQQMFPTIDRAVITSVYEEVADKELDKAIETLLQISDDSLDPASIAEGAQVSADEVMAMQILQEIMDKEDAATGGDADKVFRRIQSDQVDNERFKKQPKGAGGCGAVGAATGTRSCHHPTAPRAACSGRMRRGSAPHACGALAWPATRLDRTRAARLDAAPRRGPRRCEGGDGQAAGEDEAKSERAEGRPRRRARARIQAALRIAAR